MGVMLFRELPREDRHALHQMMRDRYGDRSDQRRADVQDLSAALRADPFDAMALQDLLVRETARRGAWQGAVEQAWLARVSAMSGAERSDYADRLLQAIESGHGPRKNGRPRD
jgi:uncharacterized membrane protein